MPVYECPRCIFSTDNRTKMKNHITRKFQCSYTKENIELNILNIDTYISKNNKKEISLEFKEPVTINITQNITQNINIVLPHNKTIVNLTDADYYEIVGRYIMSIPKMIEKIHFNEQRPENHNIYISNIKNKYAMLYDGSDWILENRDTTIHNLIIDNETRIEDWVSQEEISQKYPTAMARFEKYLSMKEKDENLARIKDEILLMLYNKRNMIKN